MLIADIKSVKSVVAILVVLTAIPLIGIWAQRFFHHTSLNKR